MKKVILMLAAALTVTACCNKQEAAPDPAEVVMQNILSRKSVRSYNGDTIPAAVMENILKAAQAAPTGMDVRPWSFVVLTDKSQYETVFAGNFNMKKFMESGAVVVVCADTTVTRPPRDNPDGPAVTTPNQIWRDDMGACTENLLLAAHAMGLGGVWLGTWPEMDRVEGQRSLFGLPDTIIPHSILALGWPDGTTQPKDKWNPERVHYGRW